ncbi:MAG: adenylate/guanylate cyclase domain-containing protein [Chloroflexota bacterium]|nr:adenylate/guanylate cyclase domain-containing protein [Chloroflexota bacterium]
MRLLGRRRWGKNPKYCRFCFTVLSTQHGGAEIECSLLFADIRGSTALAEQMTPAAFRALLNRFYSIAADILVEHDAIVDKFVGDEVMALFIPALAQERHAARAIEAAKSLLRATDLGAEGGLSIPIGVGVHTGTAFVGSVGEGGHTDLTALGDTVNVAARLASAAGAGEILVTAVAAAAAGLTPIDYEQRQLDLKGKSATTDVVVLTSSTAPVQQR